MHTGLYQSKVTFSLAAIQRRGLLAHNCKMAYWNLQLLKDNISLLAAVSDIEYRL